MQSRPWVTSPSTTDCVMPVKTKSWFSCLGSSLKYHQKTDCECRSEKWGGSGDDPVSLKGGRKLPLFEYARPTESNGLGCKRRWSGCANCSSCCQLLDEIFRERRRRTQCTEPHHWSMTLRKRFRFAYHYLRAGRPKRKLLLLQTDACTAGDKQKQSYLVGNPCLPGRWQENNNLFQFGMKEKVKIKFEYANGEFVARFPDCWITLNWSLILSHDRAGIFDPCLGSMASLDGSSRHVLSSRHVTYLNVKDDGKTGAKDVPLPKYEENF